MMTVKLTRLNFHFLSDCFLIDHVATLQLFTLVVLSVGSRRGQKGVNGNGVSNVGYATPARTLFFGNQFCDIISHQAALSRRQHCQIDLNSWHLNYALSIKLIIYKQSRTMYLLNVCKCDVILRFGTILSYVIVMISYVAASLNFSFFV